MVLTTLAQTAERSSWLPPIDLGATLASEVGFAKEAKKSIGDCVTPCLLGLSITERSTRRGV